MSVTIPSVSRGRKVRASTLGLRNVEVCGGLVRRDRRESGHAHTEETEKPTREGGNPPAQSRGEDVNKGRDTSVRPV